MQVTWLSASAMLTIACIIAASLAVQIYVAEGSCGKQLRLHDAPSTHSSLSSVIGGTHVPDKRVTRRTPVSSDPDTTTFLAFHGAGGLTNQRLCFQAGIVAATAQKFTLVLPHWHERKFDMGGTMVSQSVIYPFEHFYKKDPFMALAAANNFTIVTALPTHKSQACIAQLSAVDDATLTNETVHRWANQFGVVCMTPGNMFFHPEVLYNGQQAPPGLWGDMIAAFHPAEKFQSLIAKALQAFSATFFVTVHVRVEEDIQKHCRDNHGDNGSDFHDGRKCALTQEEYVEFLDAAGVPEGASLFVASGSSLAELHYLCKPFNCFDQALLTTDNELTYMEKAFFDFSLALKGAAFYGSLSSTFSLQLHGMFLQEGKPAAFVNPACPHGKKHCG